MTKINVINKSIITLSLTILILLLASSCREDDLEGTKYEKPNWLEGKLYTQLLAQPDLSIFAKCVELTGYDTIINVSGSYTVFAPSDEAFNTWLANNPEYNSVEDIPLPDLARLVKYHIIQDAWSIIQLRTLDVYGWIDSLDVNNDKPKGFKRETLFKKPDRWVGYKYLDEGHVVILDTTETNRKRKVVTDSRKFVPFFYPEYFDIYELSPDDYGFYFDRSFEGGNNLYIGNAMLVSKEIFAENGFIYKTDQVVDPLRSSIEILEDEKDSDRYSEYKNLLNEFPEFQYDEDATFDQEGASQGLQVDSLFNVTYPQLVFNIMSEKTMPPSGTYGLSSNVTIRYHHGLMAPSNDALDQLVNDYINISGGWGDLDGAPLNIKRIIANTHMSTNAIYPTDFINGFYNGEDDIVTLDENHIIDKEFGSNCTFVGLDKAIVPRAFSSVAGPIYLKQGYEKIMYAVEKANLLPLLKRENENYMFFVESDVETSRDSSLIYNKYRDVFSVFEIAGGQSSGVIEVRLTVNDLRNLLFSHIASERPKGNAKVEFLPNLSGGFIIVNNETGEVSGTAETTEGYKGSIPTSEFPTVVSEADNGTTYEINNWFSFNSPTLFTVISSQFPEFHALLQKAGLSNNNEYRYNFISESEFYTVFVPSATAIDSSGLNTMPVEELKNELLLHFVQGAMIFTDGNKDAGYYETVRVDEQSTPFSTVYSKLYIEPGIDIIRIRNKDGGIYTEISQANNHTNVLTGTSEETEGAFLKVVNNGVIHEIDEALTFEELDTN